MEYSKQRLSNAHLYFLPDLQLDRAAHTQGNENPLLKMAVFLKAAEHSESFEVPSYIELESGKIAMRGTSAINLKHRG